MILDDLRQAVDTAIQADTQAIQFIAQLKAEIAQLKTDNALLKDQLSTSDVDRQRLINDFSARLNTASVELKAVLS